MFRDTNDEGLCLSRYLKLLRDSNDGFDKRRFLLALVSSSAAALGVFEDDDLLVHKVFAAETLTPVLRVSYRGNFW